MHTAALPVEVRYLDTIVRFAQLGLLTDIFLYTPNLLPSTVFSIDEGFILGEGSVLCTRSQKLLSLQKSCIYIAQPHQYHAKPCVAMAWIERCLMYRHITNTALHLKPQRVHSGRF